MKELFQRAQSFLQTGEAESAEAVCAGALDQHPEDANFLCLSARALIKLEKFDSAGARLDRALTIYPQFDRAHEVRGELLLAQGQPESAVEALQQAIKLNPKRQQSRMKLGQILTGLGRGEEAQVLVNELMQLSPDNEAISRAVKFEREGQPEEAEKLYREILSRDLDNVTVMRLWANLGIQQKQYRDAEALLKRAVEQAPDFARAWADLCMVQVQLEKHDDAIGSAQRLIRLGQRLPDSHLLLASAYASAGRHDEALDAFRETLQMAPDHPGALCGMGNTLRTIGDQDGAIAAYRQCIRSKPLFTEPYWSLANLKTFRFEDSEVEDMQLLLENEELEGESPIQLCNALGLEFEGRKDYDRAFQYFERGNAIRRKREYYDPIEAEGVHEQTVEVFTREFLEKNSGIGDPDPAPIFIVGLPRSGSTLIEQILASHPQVEGTHELTDLTRTIRSIRKQFGRGARYPDSVAEIDAKGFKSLGREYIDRSRRHRGGRPFFTDKNPNNYVHVGFLHLILPNAKIIDAKRHPLDSCLGSYKQLFATGQPFTYDLVELGDYYLQYQRLMDHWHEVLPGKVLDVQYEEVVADLESQVRRILEHCGLEWNDDCLRFHETDRAVKTASSEQVRQPIYSTSVNLWRNYEAHLEPLIEILEPLLLDLPEQDRPASLGGPDPKP